MVKIYSAFGGTPTRRSALELAETSVLLTPNALAEVHVNSILATFWCRLWRRMFISVFFQSWNFEGELEVFQYVQCAVKWLDETSTNTPSQLAPTALHQTINTGPHNVARSLVIIHYSLGIACQLTSSSRSWMRLEAPGRGNSHVATSISRERRWLDNGQTWHKTSSAERHRGRGCLQNGFPVPLHI